MMRAGLELSSETMCHSEISPVWTSSVSARPSAVSSPIMPKGAPAVEGLRFQIRRVRSVVRGDGIDGAVSNAGANRFHIRGAAQRRIHLGIRAVRQHRFVRQREVVRRDFAGHPHAAALGLPHHFERARGGKMRDVQMPSGGLRHHQVARHADVLRRVGNSAHTRAFPPPALR